MQDPFSQHPLGIRVTVTHACPECPTFYPNNFCPVCLGAGQITTDRLDRWVAQQNRQQRAA